MTKELKILLGCICLAILAIMFYPKKKDYSINIYNDKYYLYDDGRLVDSFTDKQAGYLDSLILNDNQ